MPENIEIFFPVRIAIGKICPDAPAWEVFYCRGSIHPYQSLIERQQFTLIRQNIGKNYEQFSGRTLEQYFQAKTMETGLYTKVGNWWDRKGLNEIDMIALNEFDHTAVAAEIKRNPKKISMSDLQTKVDALPKSEFKQYQFELKGLSIEDM